MGYHVSGMLSHPLYCSDKLLTRSNLDTLRRLQVYFGESKTILLVEGRGPDFAPGLADLYIQKGLRVITLDLDFSLLKEKEHPGLLQYLKGEAAVLPIQKGVHGDKISAGGNSFWVGVYYLSPL